MFNPKHVTELRERRMLTREQLAQELGPPMTSAKLWAIELEKREPTEEELAILVPALGIDPEDHPKHIDDDGWRVSNSEIQTYKECRRKWWLTWYRGLSNKEENFSALRNSGDRVHRALMAWYVAEGQIREDPRDALERAITDDRTLMHANGRIPHEEELKKFAAITSVERAMVEGYIEWIEENGIDSELTVIAPETYLEVPFEHENLTSTQPVYLVGKIDVRVKRNTDNARLFIDHKTVSEVKTPTLMLPMNEQMLHYHLLEWLGTKEGEERCDGALYNMLRRVKRTGTAKPPFFARESVTHNEHELESYKQRVIGVINSIDDTKFKLASGVDPLNVVYPTPTDKCLWKCPHVHICTMFDDGSRAEDAITEYYDIIDPLDYYRKQVIHGTSRD